MAMTPEGKVKKVIKEYLKTLSHCWWFMPVSNGMGAMGVPDIIICYKGVFVGVECKAPGRENTTTPLQEKNLGEIARAHGYAVVASNVDVVKRVIEQIDHSI